MPIRSDPTRTVTLRRKFESDMRKRFNAIKRAIVNLVVDLDAFGLEEGQPFIFNVERQQYRFLTKPSKVAEFQKWLDIQINAGLLSTDVVTGANWTAKYVESAYRKGTVRAFIDSRGSALQEGAEFFEGTKAEFLRSAFAQPERLSKIQLLATRTFEHMKDASATMKKQLNITLAEGLSEGAGPRKIARRMTKQITSLTKTRALVIAQTEIVHAHAEGQLDSFVDLGVKEIGIFAEWSTAGDDRVCPMCAPLDGQLMTIKEARGQIPRHPRCRCAWIPSTMAEQKTREKKLAKAWRESFRAQDSKKPKYKKQRADYQKKLKAAKEAKKAAAKKKRKKRKAKK